MPLVQSNPDRGFSVLPSAYDPQAAPKPEPGFWDTTLEASAMLNPITAVPAIANRLPEVGAAFRMDNAVVSAFTAITQRNQFPPDPTFDVAKQLKDDGLWDQYRDNFLHVQSRGEYDQKSAKIAQETADRRTLARAGVAGTVLSMGAGLLDPTTLLPFIAEGKGALTVVKSMLLGGVAALTDEVPMRMSQETRTNAESAFSIAGGAVLGGILGGATVMLRRGAGESLGRVLDAAAGRMGDEPGLPTIHAARIAELEGHIASLEATSHSVIDRTGNPHVIMGKNTLPEKGLVAASMRQNGEVFLARPNEPHILAMEGNGFDAANPWVDDGFVNSKGEYLSRQEALDWVKQNEKANFRPSDNMGNELDALDYRDRVAQDKRIGEKTARDQQLENMRQELDTLREEQVKLQTVDQHLAEALAPGAAVGADIVERDAGGLANMLGVGERLTRIAGPVTAVLGQRVSRVGRQIMAELSNAGLRMEKNVILDAKGNVIGAVPSSQGGTVESIINSRRGDSLNLLNRAYENFADYRFGAGEQGKLPLRNTRAYVSGLVDRGPKVGPKARMNRREFFEAVGEAMLHGDEHVVPEVGKTAKEFREFYAGLLEEAQSLKIIPEEVNLLGDTSFLNRIYNQDAIARNPNRFLDILKNHMNEALQNDLATVHEGFVKAQGKDERRIADATMPAAEAAALRNSMAAELKALNALDDEQLGPIEDLVKLYRTEAVARSKQVNELQRALEGKMDPPTRKASREKLASLITERQAFRDETTRMQELGGKALEERAARRAELKSRMRNLNRNRFFVEEKARKKFDKIDQLEEDNIDSLHRVVGAGNRALKAVAKNAKDFDKELAALEGAVKEAQTRALKYETEVNALHEKAQQVATESGGISAGEVDPVDDVLAKVWEKEQRSANAVDKFNDAQDQLDSFKNINWAEGGQAEAVQTIRDALDEAVARANAAITKRAKRMAKLESDAAKFDKGAWDERLQSIRDRMTERRQKNIDRLQEMGADDAIGGLETGKTTFTGRAEEIAQMAMDRIQGTNIRLAGFDAMNDKRGTELARTLSVPSDKLTPYGFLNNDAEQALHAYVNTLIPDIEITRRLGPLAPDGELNETFKRLNEERFRVLDAVQKDFEAKAAKAGKPVDVAKMEARLSAVKQEYDGMRDNIVAVIRRMRHQWGVPTNPNGYLARGVTAVRGLQALVYLGGVVVGSLNDFGKPVMKYGLARHMQSAWLPMLTNWKAIHMSMEEAQRAYVAVETLTADRAHQLTDTMAMARRKSRGEAALDWGVSKLPIIAGFGPWTDVMKTFSTMSYTSKVMDSLEKVLTQSGKDLPEATGFLNSLGWDSAMQSRIWKQMQEGGAEKIKGVWVPQTEKWTDKEAVRSFRAAMNNEASASIVSPGVELPKWMNSSQTGKIIGSLKSFAMASTSKTLMAALQQRDMAVLNGVWISLALGGLSVYLRTMGMGGTAVERMHTWSPQEWTNRAIDASGLLGAISLATQVGSDLTAGVSSGTTGPQKLLQGARQLVGAYNVSDPKGALISDAFGPTADLADLLASAVASGHWTPAEIHRVRSLLPLQNVTYLRRLFDAMENAVGGDRQ